MLETSRYPKPIVKPCLVSLDEALAEENAAAADGEEEEGDPAIPLDELLFGDPETDDEDDDWEDEDE